MSIDLLPIVTSHPLVEEEVNIYPHLNILKEIKDVHIVNISKDLDTLSQVQGKSMLITFEDDNEQQDVDILTRKISQNIRKIHQSLKSIEVLPVDDAKIRDNIVRGLLEKLRLTSNRFIEIQYKHIQKLEEREEFLPPSVQTVQLIDDRSRDIQKITKDISELNGLFEDLQLLVNTQGEILSTIEGNVNRSINNMEGGNAELKIASHHQTKSRSKLCGLLLCFIILICVLVLIIKISITRF